MGYGVCIAAARDTLLCYRVAMVTVVVYMFIIIVVSLLLLLWLSLNLVCVACGVCNVVTCVVPLYVVSWYQFAI
jgi:hypothetical protein